MKKTVAFFATMVVLLAGSTAAAPSAQAESVWVCAHSVTWTFDPPLTLTQTTGEFSVEWSSLCKVDSSGPIELTATSGSRSGAYTGTCLLALASSPGGGGVSPLSATIVGGSLIEHHGFGDSAEFGDLSLVLPDSLCNQRNGSGVAVGFVTFS